ncbi:exopolysaccharide production protein ExoQ [Methylobacterium sp. RAS18]|nr:exopolysaccharide production protein ExoQ [Methylobacterium sp. RAS18]
MRIVDILVAGFIFTATLFAETVGSVPLYFCMVGLSCAFLIYPHKLVETVRMTGIVPWLFPGFLALSAMWSLVPGTTLRFALQSGLTLLFAAQITRLVNRQQFAVIMLAVCGAVCVASLVSGRMGMDGLTGRMNLVGVLSHKNSLGYCASLLAIISAAILTNATSTPLWRCLAALGLLIGCVTALKSGSVGALAALTMGILTFVALSLPGLYPARQRASVVEISALIGAASLVGLGLGAYFFRDTLLAAVGKDATLTGRTTLWFYAERIWPERPLLGMGGASFWVQGYGPAEALWRLMMIKSRTGFHFHNLIYQTLVETGLIGLGLLGLYIADALRHALSTLRNNFSTMAALYLSIALYTLIIQMQGVDLMQPFAPAFLVFAVSAFYAKQSAVARLHAASAPAITGRMPVPVQVHPTIGAS